MRDACAVLNVCLLHIIYVRLESTRPDLSFFFSLLLAHVADLFRRDSATGERLHLRGGLELCACTCVCERMCVIRDRDGQRVRGRERERDKEGGSVCGERVCVEREREREREEDCSPPARTEVLVDVYQLGADRKSFRAFE